MDGDINESREVDMIVYISQKKKNKKKEERDSLISKILIDRRYIWIFLCDSSEKNYIHLVKVIGKSI